MAASDILAGLAGAPTKADKRADGATTPLPNISPDLIAYLMQSQGPPQGMGAPMMANSDAVSNQPMPGDRAAASRAALEAAIAEAAMGARGPTVRAPEAMLSPQGIAAQAQVRPRLAMADNLAAQGPGANMGPMPGGGTALRQQMAQNGRIAMPPAPGPGSAPRPAVRERPRTQTLQPQRSGPSSRPQQPPVAQRRAAADNAVQARPAPAAAPPPQQAQAPAPVRLRSVAAPAERLPEPKLAPLPPSLGDQIPGNVKEMILMEALRIAQEQGAQAKPGAQAKQRAA